MAEARISALFNNSPLDTIYVEVPVEVGLGDRITIESAAPGMSHVYEVVDASAQARRWVRLKPVGNGA